MISKKNLILLKVNNPELIFIKYIKHESHNSNNLLQSQDK